MQENVEKTDILLLGDGAVETILCALLNVHGVRCVQAKLLGRRCLDRDSSATIYEKREDLTIRAQYDPLQRIEYAQSMLSDAAFDAGLNNYLTLEKVQDLYTVVNGRALRLPLRKEKLLDAEIEPMQKRRILQFITALKNIASLEAPAALTSCRLTRGTQILNQQEEMINNSKLTFEQLAEQFKLGDLAAPLAATLQIEMKAPFEDVLYAFCRMRASFDRFSGGTTYLVSQYGGSDILQAFERATFVYNGLVLQESDTIGREVRFELSDARKRQDAEVEPDAETMSYPFVFKFTGMQIKAKKVLRLRCTEQKRRRSYAMVICRESASITERFRLDEIRNAALVDVSFQCVIRKGSGQPLSKGLISFEFSGYDSESFSPGAYLTEKLGVAPADILVSREEPALDLTKGEAGIAGYDFVEELPYKAEEPKLHSWLAAAAPLLSQLGVSHGADFSRRHLFINEEEYNTAQLFGEKMRQAAERAMQ